MRERERELERGGEGKREARLASESDRGNPATESVE